MTHDDYHYGLQAVCREFSGENFLARLRKRRGMILNEEEIFYAEYIRGMFSDAVNANPVAFYLEDIPFSDKDFLKTAEEFFEAGILNLPYPQVYICPKSFDVAGDIQKVKGVVMCWQDDNGWWLPVFGERPGVKKEPLPIAFFHMKRNLNLPVEEIKIPDFENVTGTTITEARVLAGNGFKCVLLACMMMNMPHYDKNKEIISEKLAKARIKSNKPPLAGYTTIRMRKDIKACMDKNSALAGYSVRPHWRRGHIRRISDTKQIPVRPCMVNFGGDADLDKNVYKVKG